MGKEHDSLKLYQRCLKDFEENEKARYLLKKYEGIHPVDLMEDIHERLSVLMLKIFVMPTETEEQDREFDAVVRTLEEFCNDLWHLMAILKNHLFEGNRAYIG